MNLDDMIGSRVIADTEDGISFMGRLIASDNDAYLLSETWSTIDGEPSYIGLCIIGGPGVVSVRLDTTMSSPKSEYIH